MSIKDRVEPVHIDSSSGSYLKDLVTSSKICEPHKSNLLEIVDRFGLMPLPSVYKGKRSTTKWIDDPESIVRLWERKGSEPLNYGLVLPKGVLVMDFDKKYDGLATLKHLEDNVSENFSNYPKVLTPGGGVHAYARCNEITKNYQEILKGLDIRAERGFIMLPPSVHVNGGIYRYEDDAEFNLEKAPFLEPAIVDSFKSRMPSSAGKTSDVWCKISANKVEPGNRHKTIASIFGKFISPSSMPPRAALSLTSCFNELKCDPPLPSDEVHKICRSIWNAEMRKRGAN